MKNGACSRRRIDAGSRCRERGSALLIVFLFAAIVAITLYTEMPVVMFEAKRQKEQTLIDRGNEYAHGVKLFVRKMRLYPASFDALENTNRMRFLRRRYKDPFTGKDDWRLLHAGPNGIIIDSKVNPVGAMKGLSGANAGNANAGKQSSPFGNSSSFGNSSNTSSGSTSSTSFGGFNTASSAAPAETTDLPVRDRPPAVSSAGTGPGSGSGGPESVGANGATPDQMASFVPRSMVPADSPSPSALAGQPAQPGQPGAAGAAVPGGQPGAAAGNANPNSSVGGLLSNPNPKQPQTAGGVAAGGSGGFGGGLSSSGSGSAFGSSSGSGNLQSGGGIAGVASKSEGHSIKAVNDQENYSRWEFFYDPTKDTTASLGGAGGGLGGQQQQPGAGNRPGQGGPGGNRTQGGGFSLSPFSGNNSGQRQPATTGNSPFGGNSPPNRGYQPSPNQ